MGGFSFVQGRMNWDRNIYAWEQGTPRPALRGVNSQPMFNVGGIISGAGKTSASKIIAYTDSFGNVTNSYTD